MATLMDDAKVLEKRENIRSDNEKAHNSLLVELKARVDDLERVRKTIESMAAKRTEILKQTDTYFKVRKGRLKLREIEGSSQVALIYYVREDVARPKKSNVLILTFRKPMAVSLKRMLKKALGTKVVVAKVREVYHYRGIRIHLDTVKSLGTFVEFEKSVSRKQVKNARSHLEKLLQRLGIDEKSLERASYGDLAFKRA
jgi:predicted adenylyl cyclase CyaB